MEKAIEKAGILIEALPYIRQFRGKVIVIKYGGGEKLRRDFVKDVVFMKFVGLEPVLVHGGGAAINDEMKAVGKQSEFINGLRVTDRETLDIVETTLMKINREIAGLIEEAGCKAVSINGKEFIKARRSRADIGFVGEIDGVDNKLMNVITHESIPVISPLGKGEEGQTFNINADEFASGVAGSIGAEKIVLMTDVPGIMNGETVISSIRVDDCAVLIENGVITGGMIPKVNSCAGALKAGVRKAHIVDGRVKHSLLLEIFTDKGIGTEIVE